MLANGLTTWAETAEPTRSDSHAWSAHPTYDLLSSVAGVMPGSPGFESVRIEPHLGRLGQVSASVPAPDGVVFIDLRVESMSTIATIDLPKGLPGKFVWNGRTQILHQGTSRLRLHRAKLGKSGPDMRRR